MAAAVALVLTLTTGITVAIALYLRAEQAFAESEYRNYVMTINLADSEIRAGLFASARARLGTIPFPSRMGMGTPVSGDGYQPVHGCRRRTVRQPAEWPSVPRQDLSFG